MRLTVLGSSASYAGAGQACSGYLVEGARGRVLLDCGSGVVANLTRVADPLSLQAVFLSHMHPDHVVDVYALHALLRYAPQGPAPAIALHAPAGAVERLGCLLSEHGREAFGEAFVVSELRDGASAVHGDLSVTARVADHDGDAYAFTVAGPGGTLCYTGDTAYGRRALDAARGCDLLVAEATLPERYAGRAPHMTASEAARLAAEAQVKELALVHLWPTNDREEVLEAAEAVFDGPVVLPGELDVFEL